MKATKDQRSDILKQAWNDVLYGTPIHAYKKALIKADFDLPSDVTLYTDIKRLKEDGYKSNVVEALNPQAIVKRLAYEAMNCESDNARIGALKELSKICNLYDNKLIVENKYEGNLVQYMRDIINEVKDE